jgi:trimeric autotransporter adhesin
MNPSIQFKTTGLPFLIAFALACFGVSPTGRAVSPTPDGSYAGANTAEGGSGALASLTTGSNNTALGAQALFSLTDGIQNTAVGAQALKSNTGVWNTAVGFQALVSNTVGGANTAVGWRALFKNTATGSQIMLPGLDNTAVGFEALYSNTTGQSNTALGAFAGMNLTTGIGNICIGKDVFGVAGESNTIRIGDNLLAAPQSSACFIGGISGQSATGGAMVFVTTAGKLGTLPSSARFKTEIKPMDKASEAIHALKPVTFHYKQEIDPEETPQFGLVAEQVEKVNPDLIVRDKEGKPYTVRYEAVNAMLLNEFLKEHRKNEEQEATIARQQKQIEALTAGLQKVSAQLETSRPAPRMVDNHQ